MFFSENHIPKSFDYFKKLKPDYKWETLYQNDDDYVYIDVNPYIISYTSTNFYSWQDNAINLYKPICYSNLPENAKYITDKNE